MLLQHSSGQSRENCVNQSGSLTAEAKRVTPFRCAILVPIVANFHTLLRIFTLVSGCYRGDTMLACGEMAEWSNAPDSKLGAVLKAFSALHQCMPANERFLAIIRRPTCSKIAGKKLCSLSLIGVAMRMPQNRVDCDAGSQHCYAGESSEFSRKAAPVLTFWDLYSQETPTQTPAPFATNRF